MRRNAEGQKWMGDESKKLVLAAIKIHVSRAHMNRRR